MSTQSAIDTPRWVTDTPEEPHYILAMFLDGSAAQEVEISRDEFIELKTRLAELRSIRA